MQVRLRSGEEAEGNGPLHPRRGEKDQAPWRLPELVDLGESKDLKADIFATAPVLNGLPQGWGGFWAVDAQCPGEKSTTEARHFGKHSAFLHVHNSNRAVLFLRAEGVIVGLKVAIHSLALFRQNQQCLNEFGTCNIAQACG